MNVWPKILKQIANKALKPEIFSSAFLKEILRVKEEGVLKYNENILLWVKTKFLNSLNSVTIIPSIRKILLI